MSFRDALNLPKLQDELRVSKAVLQGFLDRFAPSLVADGAYAAPADIMLFVHIPKTAGMSVGKSLQSAFDIFRGVDWREPARSFWQHSRDACYYQTIHDERQVIMGHYGWPELMVWRNHEMPMKCATIIRDPVQRYISNYNYNCSQAHPNWESFKEKYPTITEFVEAQTMDTQMTQMVGMISSFENGLEKLTRHYTFIGVTEHLAASLTHLGRSHGLPKLEEHFENAGDKPTAGADISAELRQLIEDKSQNDLRLHRLMSRIYATV